MLVREYEDDGYTGTNFDRPGFVKMMEAIEQGEADCIIVKDLSRFGRDYIDAGKYIQKFFPLQGIRFIAINDNIDTNRNDQTDDLIKEGISIPGNHALVYAFTYMNIMEHWGSGIPRIIRRCKEEGLKEPELLEVGGNFRINLYRFQDKTREGKSTEKYGKVRII